MSNQLANKELEPTKGAMPGGAAPFAAQFRRSADPKRHNVPRCHMRLLLDSIAILATVAACGPEARIAAPVAVEVIVTAPPGASSGEQFVVRNTAAHSAAFVVSHVAFVVQRPTELGTPPVAQGPAGWIADKVQYEDTCDCWTYSWRPESPENGLLPGRSAGPFAIAVPPRAVFLCNLRFHRGSLVQIPRRSFIEGK